MSYAIHHSYVEFALPFCQCSCRYVYGYSSSTVKCNNNVFWQSEGVGMACWELTMQIALNKNMFSWYLWKRKEKWSLNFANLGSNYIDCDISLNLFIWLVISQLMLWYWSFPVLISSTRTWFIPWIYSGLFLSWQSWDLVSISTCICLCSFFLIWS